MGKRGGSFSSSMACVGPIDRPLKLTTTAAVLTENAWIPLAKSVGRRREPAFWVPQRGPVGRTPLGFRSTGRLRQRYPPAFRQPMTVPTSGPEEGRPGQHSRDVNHQRIAPDQAT